MSLCQTFRELSYQTWIQLGKARQVKHQILEESITDSLMVELKLRHPYDVITTTFTRHEEGKNGADWEWWFVDSTGTKGIGFRVQAKIINFKNDSFEQLHYKNQTNILINKAKKIKGLLIPPIARKLINPRKNLVIDRPLIPLYCLYIHDNNLWSKLHLGLSGILLNHTIEHYGCSIMSADDVLRLKKKPPKKKVSDVVNYIMPWHYLVCPTYSSTSVKSLPEKVRDSVVEHDLVEDFDKPYYGILPFYVKDIMLRETENFIDKNDSRYESFNDLHGIMIIKDNKDLV